ncbi:cytochrome P450 [Pseudoneurospora amorphoporcata]|uniref:Cytochrome P450 n=1 Tax=Pseudoneurospora amorphoporcata TaxID=241081 RepID=A0AAN6NS73_9PEZI|nr:cytochrome P450 [Pseudoneurospora amorphoporcata]
MRLTSAIFALAAATLSLASDPSDCSTTSKEKTGSDFQLTEQADNANVVSLSKIFTAAGKKVSVADVFNDGNHQMTTDSSGRKLWQHTSDFNDEDTTKWVPQGITSTADALDVGTYEGINGWIVSWHRDDDKSVRVTFVNRADDTYRHALLVYPHASDDFREVPVHAGGIMWYGNTLWVVDTYNGIRVFDLTNIWQVGNGDNVGKVSSGVYSAAGYKYVIPQIRWYKWSSSFEFRHSYMALDRTTTPDSLIVGEYQTSTSDPIRLVRYELDYTTRRLKTDSSGVSKAIWAYCVNIERMQGAVSANGKFYLSRSNGASKGDLWAWVPGGAAKQNSGFYPRSPEDLSYDQRNGGRLYTVTEAEGVRYIINSAVSKPSSWAGIGLLSLGFVALLYVVEKKFFAQCLPKGVPFIREPLVATRFSLKTRWAYITDCANLHKEAYENAIIIPGVGFRNELILPPSSYKWINTYADDRLSASHAFAEYDQIAHSLGNDVFIKDPWQGTTVKNDLNPSLDNLMDALNDEVGVAFDAYLDSTPGEWVEGNIMDVMKRVIAQADSRFTVGLPLCRNQEYLQTSVDINEQFITTAGTGLASPGVLRPIYDQRLEYLKRPRTDADPNEPRDHFQIMLRYVQRERPHEFGNFWNITTRVATANFGSMHQSAFMMTNLILNILSSDKEFNTVCVLREELERVAHSDGNPGTWTKAKMANIVRGDSMQRETLRLNTFGGRGCTSSVLSYAPQTSESKYEQAIKFDPFRFSRIREQQVGKEGGPPLTFVSTSLDYLPFSNGRHACPGRFLIDFEIKMAMANLFGNYDVELPTEYKGERPPTVWLTEAQFPPMDARMRVRRREKV